MYPCREEAKSDNKVPMYKEKSLARRQKGTQTVNLSRVESKPDNKVLMYKEKSLARDTADQDQIRPALLSLSTMIQLTVMSATRVHRRKH